MSTREKKPINTLADDLGERSRDLWLAGLGALATAEEESTKLIGAASRQRDEVVKDIRKRLEDLQGEAEQVFQDLVKRGEKVERKGRKELDARLEAAKTDVETARKNVAKQGETAAGRVERLVAGAVETAMGRLDVPTRTEVKNLSTQLDRLADRVNRLTALLQQQTTKVYHVVPHEDGWAVKQEGVETPLFETGTKADALELARERARLEEPSRLVVHRKDGTVMEQTAYGTD